MPKMVRKVELLRESAVALRGNSIKIIYLFSSRSGKNTSAIIQRALPPS